MHKVVQISLFVVCVLLSGCNAPEENWESGNQKMADALRQIADETEANPIRNVHVNKARVSRLEQIPLPPNPQQQISYLGQLGQEQLHAGYNREAIETFSRILKLLQENADLAGGGRDIAVKDYLGISYMRLAEEENCLDNHSIDRCLWPIQAGGIHQKETGSRAAIEMYTEILEQEPGDMNAVWLLNVAYMTLGRYPDGVPESWRIPEEALQSDFILNRFEDAAMHLGLDVMGLSGGAIMDDFTGDGLLDIIASSWGLRDSLAFMVNNGDGSFSQRASASGLEGLTGGLNIVQADYNNDGHLDFFVMRGAWLGEGHPNSLLRNRGNGVFDDVTASSGLLSFHPTQTAAWGDYNNDGWIDLFVGNETSEQGGEHPSELYRNNGDGTFTNVAGEAGVEVHRYVKGVVWGDIDNDGLLDLYVSNWGAPNHLYRNMGAGSNGTWIFEDVAAGAGVREPEISFPAWFWDYDNDGWLDLFVSGWKAQAGDVAAEYMNRPIKAELPRLYRNQGDGTFDDVTTEARLDKVMYTMGSNFGDLDNDGYLDFYVGTGDPDFRSLMPNRMFRNAAGAFFQEVTASGGFGHLQKGHGVAFGDLDNDGDQDVYAVIGGAYEGDVFGNVLFENPGQDNAWITLDLEGRESNRSAIGTRISITVQENSGTRTIHRVVGSGGSFGASSLQQEIGLGNAASIETIEVIWPVTGERQAFTEVAMNRRYVLREGERALEPGSLEALELTP